MYVYMHTRRVASTCTTAELAVGWNGRGLRFDADGRGEPHGYTVTSPRPGASTAVTLRATASASAGTAVVDARSSTAVQPAPTGAVVRVSITRCGTIAWNPLEGGASCVASGAGPVQPSAWPTPVCGTVRARSPPTKKATRTTAHRRRGIKRS